MLRPACASLLLLLVPAVLTAADPKTPDALKFVVKSIAGEEVDLSKYQGKVLLVVNVASRCGKTPQYKELQALHETYGAQGLAVLGFPCNQFGRQEPGTEAEIQEFCESKYGVEFDMFSKIDVNGEGAADFYKYLKSVDTEPKGPGDITWNFEKFVIGRDGRVVARFTPNDKPSSEKVVSLLEAELKK